MLYFITFLILAIIILFIFRNKKKKLTANQKKEITKFFNNIKKAKSNKEKIIDFDKLYHKILIEL
jgi:ABC-type phosphate/phosphonate transport system substrate-binding protein